MWSGLGRNYFQQKYEGRVGDWLRDSAGGWESSEGRRPRNGSEVEREECSTRCEVGGRWRQMGGWEMVRGEPILRLLVGLTRRMVRASVWTGSSGGEQV